MTIDETWFKKPLLDAWYLSGPTASGKTQVALDLATRLDAEIVSLDSMAVYRGMDIGTAKPSADQLRKVPHHLIDMVEPTEDYSVSQFVVDAHRVADEIRSRGKKVLFVGGTPLYLKTLVRGMFSGPPADWEFRQQVAEDTEKYGFKALRERLAQVDPLSAHKILLGDVRRMTRALEVARLTGQPLSHWQTQFERAPKPEECRVFVLGWDRAAIHQRVQARVLRMFDNGLVNEVQGLLDRYSTLGRTAMQAVGYKEPIDYLHGKRSLAETLELVIIHTRQFVRRQEIWFRSLPEIRRIPIADPADLSNATERILASAV
ncbi:MAG: tRNA (adenosine(37)-N6)-dimethylallyltransferase MiaA [Pirellulaceae bacterium]|nr:tRNA (adenosine(37)-N6)-dimethylallyltransferase MiaA [Pirellulaceae bacterium]